MYRWFYCISEGTFIWKSGQTTPVLVAGGGGGASATETEGVDGQDGNDGMNGGNSEDTMVSETSRLIAWSLSDRIILLRLLEESEDKEQLVVEISQMTNLEEVVQVYESFNLVLKELKQTNFLRMVERRAMP